MKQTFKLFLVALVVTLTASRAMGVDVVTPKLEMRSAWVATVWALDWPSSMGSSMEAQKADMTKLLDSLAVNNFNAVNFQVRGMSDAMYKSSYEPWSQYITGTRGKDPGWDPFEFFVAECHKRGIECHAWVNPYRFNSSGTAGGQEGDVTGYIEKGWTINGGSGKILNPGIPEVQDRIVDICKEITQNYDIDGMLFDDYYYNGAALSEDANLYNSYKAAGGTLSQADWRRKNVTMLMQKLNNMFKETKPWVRFGQAPQGTTYTSRDLANKYGIDPCPCGYDNNYGSQYIDIMEWLDLGLIDFISPQVYWTMAHDTNPYDRIVSWWSYIVDHFNRHLFVSQSISSLTSGADVTAPTIRAGGAGNNTFSEFANEIMHNRSSSLNGSCGSIFYSAKYLYRIGTKPSFAHYLKRHLFSRLALMPAMTWKEASDPGKVQNLVYDEESLLAWDAMANMRYSVYAVPNGVELDAMAKNVDYLIGMTYEPQFTVPEDYRSGYYFAVCPYDRYANEWEPTAWKPNYTETLPAPTIISPEDGFSTGSDFTLKWNAVQGATKYIVDFATDAEFKNLEKSVQLTETSMSVSKVYGSISKNVPVYWRVHAAAKGVNDGISEVRSFTYQVVSLLTPANNSDELDPKVHFTWSDIGAGATATLEVSTVEDFSNIVLSRESSTCEYQCQPMELHPLTAYYARVLVNGNASNVVTFSTKAMPCEPPTFLTPIDGGICYANGRIEINPQEGAEFVLLQVDSENSFSGRRKYQVLLDNYQMGVNASDVKLSSKNPMVDGVTYYARALCKYYMTSQGGLYETDYGPVITFTYSAQEGGVGDITAEKAAITIDGNTLHVSARGNIAVEAVTLLGSAVPLYAGNEGKIDIDLSDLPAGLYVIRVKAATGSTTAKFLKK